MTLGKKRRVSRAVEYAARRNFSRRLNLMKSPTPESSFKLIEAVSALLQCDELQRDDVSASTHEVIEGVLETVGQVRRECEFPDRAEIIEFFAKRFAEENREMLVKRVVALVGTLSEEELYSSYQEARESDRGRG